MEYFYIAQIFGAIALVTEMIRFQIKDPKKIFYAEPVLNISYFVQFFLLGAASAYAVSIISIARGFAGITLNEKHLRRAILYVFMPAYLSTLAYTNINSIIDLLPVMAIMCSTTSFLYQSNRKLVARLFILNSLFWITYAASVGAYIMVFSSALIMSSIIIGIIRHEKRSAMSVPSDMERA